MLCMDMRISYAFADQSKNSSSGRFIVLIPFRVNISQLTTQTFFSFEYIDYQLFIINALLNMQQLAIKSNGIPFELTNSI